MRIATIAKRALTRGTKSSEEGATQIVLTWCSRRGPAEKVACAASKPVASNSQARIGRIFQFTRRGAQFNSREFITLHLPFSCTASYACADLPELIGSQTALGRHFQIGQR